MKKYSSIDPLYLDYNATTPVDPQVLEQMLPWFSQHFGNASSSLHAYGWRAAEAVKIAREKVSALLGTEPEEICFTSGATEALNLAIIGLFEANSKYRNQLISFKTEHKAVLDTLQYIQKRGAEVLLLDVDRNGLPDLDALIKHTSQKTLAVIAMLANNETGVLNPVAEIAAIAHSAGAISVCDATQACGKIKVNITDTGADLLALSAHKMFGPKGIGALFVKRKMPRIRLNAQIHGGGHEKGLRSGTLNVPGIVGLGAAAELAAKSLPAYARTAELRSTLEHKLIALGASLNGADAGRIPNTTNFRFNGRDAATLIAALPDIGFSTGSACSSAQSEPSHVLQAMGLSAATCKESMRISLGRFNTPEEITYISAKFADALQKS